jgi:hypothetical protein
MDVVSLTSSDTECNAARPSAQPRPAAKRHGKAPTRTIADKCTTRPKLATTFSDAGKPKGRLVQGREKVCPPSRLLGLFLQPSQSMRNGAHDRVSRPTCADDSLKSLGNCGGDRNRECAGELEGGEGSGVAPDGRSSQLLCSGNQSPSAQSQRSSTPLAFEIFALSPVRII